MLMVVPTCLALMTHAWRRYDERVGEVPGALVVERNVLEWRLDPRSNARIPEAVDHDVEMEEKHRFEAEISEAKKKALAAGGLYVLGTERHESRRIDNQLRGRTGRQGDPGHSKFFLSCEDDLLRIFAGERLDAIMRSFGVQRGEAITHKWLNSAIASFRYCCCNSCNFSGAKEIAGGLAPMPGKPAPAAPRSMP